jgi:protein-S-isoprenylcysteine O-methyltransferase Ste14
MPGPWWKGTRGEWFVVAQAVLLVLVFLGPRRWFGWPAAALPLPTARLVAGSTLAVLGAALFLAGLAHLGANLTPLPYPKDSGTLVQSGAYRLARHPLYGGLILACAGWGLMLGSIPTLLYVGALCVLLDVKARREEAWLAAKHPEYGAYRARVRKLIPFLY